MTWNSVCRVSLLLALPTLTFADVIKLKDGRVLDGEIIQDDEKVLKIKVKNGALTIDRKDVASIEKKSTPAQEYKERLARLDSKNAAAQAEMGVWAGSRGLAGEAVLHCLEAWKLDPTLKAASDELERQDYHLVSGVWQNPDTYYPGRGYLKLDGRWYKPLEHAWRSSLKQVEVLSSARTEAKTVLAAAQARVARTEAQKSADLTKIDRLEGEIKDAEEALPGAKDVVAAAETDLNAAQTELQSSIASEGSGGKTSGSSDARRKVAAAEAALGKARKAVVALESALASHPAEIEKTRQGLGLVDAEKARGVEEVAKRGEELRRAEEAVKTESSRAAKAKEAWEKSK
ncbi:MAG: hypothetical protein AAB074_15885 [Planctomycetota bacterium]